MNAGAVVTATLVAAMALAPRPAAATPPGEESGLVAPVDAGDSAARRAARGALWLPRTVIAAALWPLELGSYAAERYQVADRTKRVLFNDAETLGVVPTARLESGFGLTLGARVVHRDLLGRGERVDVRAGAGGRFRQLHRIALRSGERLGRVSLDLDGEYERRPRDPYHEELADGDVVLHRYRHRIARVTAAVDVRATEAWFVRAAASLADHELGADGGEMPALPGWDGTRAAYAELELRHDSRRAARSWEPPSHASAGTLAAAFAGRSTALDHHPDFWRYGVDLQQFVRIAGGPRAIALRAHLEALAGGGERVPFHELPRLGGATLLRGYPSDRFRERAAAMASAEYRWDLSRAVLASVFVDAGRADRRVRELADGALRVGYGVGLELHTDASFLARVSVASSVDGGVFVDLSLDPVFAIEPRVERR